MKWVKISIGVVIAVTMVGFIVTSVHSMTQETITEQVVTFELLENYQLTPYAYDTIEEYAILNGTVVGNVLSISINGDYNLFDPLVFTLNTTNNEFKIRDQTGFGPDFTIKPNNTWVAQRGVDTGDIIEITFDEIIQPPQLTGVIATLLLLSPLIFTGGVLAFMLNKQEF